MARAATSPELVLFRTPEQKSRPRAAIFSPTTIYTARINQTFTSLDGVLEITYDGGSGTLSDVLPDMTVCIGSSAGAWDVGICRLRSIDATKVYIAQEASISFADNQYLTIVDDFGLYAKHVLISSGVPYMDGGVAYTDQHANPDPVPIMGGNRVVEKTGSTVSQTFDWTYCYMPDGTAVTGFVTTAPGSTSITGGTTTAPTITWNSVGWKKVYLTLTGANGKVFWGVRYVFIWDATNEPAHVVPGQNGQDVDSGGWEFSMTLFDNCDLTSIRDHALVIVFTEDHYGSTNTQIGPLTGCENILFTGWIAKESINMNPEQGAVEFTAYSAQYWMQRIPSYPDGVEITSGAPTAWTEFQNLTVDKGVWHFLHWRTTATRIMDCFLSGDTKYTQEVSSLAGNLWEQIKEMAFDQIFARPGVTEYNQLYIQVYPNLMPLADRTGIPTVMDIQTQDWAGRLAFDRVTVPECAVVAASGVYVTAAGVGTPYFSLAPGHTYPHYGTIESIERLLVASQSQANTLTALYRAWRNNPLPEIPIPLAANNRLIGCFPNQFCSITIDANDNVRGYAYSGKLIPTSKTYVFDEKRGYLHTELTFEAETSESGSLVVDGDVPGQGDRSVPPLPPLPALPAAPPLFPNGFPTSAYSGGPPQVILHDLTIGLVYSVNFDASSPNWATINAGLTRFLDSNPLTPNYRRINYVGICKNGAIYVAYIPPANPWDAFIARAPSVGGTFTYLYDAADPALNLGNASFQIWSCAVNPNVTEQFAFIMGGSASGARRLYVGAAGTYAQGSAALDTDFRTGFGNDNLSYGVGEWLATGYHKSQRIAIDGNSVLGSYTWSQTLEGHIRVPSTAISYHHNDGTDDFVKSINNMLSEPAVQSSGNTYAFGAAGGTDPLYFDCDPTGTFLMGRVFVGARGKSTDGGVTWATLPSLPVGNYWFRYAGKSGETGPTSRWIAAGGSVVRLSLNGGTDWLNREGDLTSLIATPNIDLVRVVGY
jgi:hypothetical protein